MLTAVWGHDRPVQQCKEVAGRVCQPCPRPGRDASAIGQTRAKFSSTVVGCEKYADKTIPTRVKNHSIAELKSDQSRLAKGPARFRHEPAARSCSKVCKGGIIWGLELRALWAGFGCQVALDPLKNSLFVCRKRDCNTSGKGFKGA